MQPHVSEVFAAFIGLAWADQPPKPHHARLGATRRAPPSPRRRHSPSAQPLDQRARRTTLEGFFRAHHVRSADVMTTRIEAIKSARALTTEDGVIAPTVLLVHARVAQLRVPLQAIADCDKAIAQRAQAHPDFPLFDALPGAGAVFAPRLLVACGAQRERLPSADDLQQ
jgi:hypothetical protein